MSTENNEYPYPYPYYDEKSGKVNCQLCGKPYLVISPMHLKKAHNIKYEEYKLRFPDAPLSSEEFAVRGLYGKNKDMFNPTVEEPVGEEVIITEEDYPDEVDEEEIKIEELKESVKPKKEKSADPIIAMKRKVFNHLSLYLTNVRQDYIVEEKTLGGKTKYSYITDFCDPVLRIIIDFPNTFWHNQDSFQDPLKKEKLTQDGWRWIEIKSKAPNLEDIEKELGIK